jgi:hypothetical protein
MSILRTPAVSKAVRVLAAVGLISSATLALSTSSEAAAGGGLTPASGGALTSQVVSLAGTGFANVAGTSQVLPPGGSTYGVSFAPGTCAADAATAHTAGQIDAVSAAVASSTRLVVRVPGGPGSLADTVTAGIESKKDYNLCVYSANVVGGLNKLLTSAKYTVYPRPTLAATGFLSATSGPSFGGQTISVVGDTTSGASATVSGYFTAKTTATLGGVPLLSIKVAKDGNSFSAVTPPIPAGPVDLVVTTEGGSVTQPAAYTSSSAVIVSPSLVSVDGGTVLTIKGKGFNAIQGAAGFGVLFYSGSYDAGSNPGTPCTDIQTLSDVELVCTSPALTTGAYNVMVTDDLTGAAATFASVPSSGATVTAGGF